MSTLKEPPPVKFFASVLLSKNADTEKLIQTLAAEFGDMDYTSEHYEFNQTRYYEEEMGTGLKRIVLSFRELIRRERIVDIKIRCNTIEEMFADSEGNRTVNIDPGYIAGEHLILSTGKGYYHRPYLGRGVYADLTLVYRDNNFKSLEWTYPDYKVGYMQQIFHRIRDIYMNDLNRAHEQ